jgi:hypothetical protein
VRQKTELAEVLGVPPERIRVVSLDVGVIEYEEQQSPK